jgi:tRNA pseudouridine13 synthase
MREAQSEAKTLEDKIFSSSDITLDQLRKIGAEGTRRLGRIIPDIMIKPASDGLSLSFSLPAGAYATTVLREFMKEDVNTYDFEDNDQKDSTDDDTI